MNHLTGKKSVRGMTKLCALCAALFFACCAYAADSQNVELVGSWPFGPAYAVAKDDARNAVFLGSGGGIYVLNVSNPASPQKISEIKTPGHVRGFFYLSDKLYVADDESGLRIIDVSNLSNPYEIGFYDTPGSAFDIYVSGSYAYVADWGSGLRIINISNPVSPVETGFYYTAGYTYDVHVSGNYAYVAGGSSGLRIVNISNPVSPVETGFFNITGTARSVHVSGNYAFVADWYNGLRIVNISNPASPVETGFFDTPGYPYCIYVSGNYAYVADGPGGLRIINISSPDKPVETGFFNTSGYYVYVSGHYAFMVDGSEGLRIVDISNPASPVETGFFNTPGDTLGVYVSGNYAYVANGSGGLRIVNISTVEDPVETGFFDTADYAYDVYVSGNYAYLADGSGGLRIINISSPDKPVEIGYYDTPGDSRGVYVSGSYAYVADGWGLRIINISSPDKPVETGFYHTPGTALDVYVSGSYAYVADGSGGLRIINISSPDKPVETGFHNTSDYTYDVYVSGSYAYMADSSAGGLRIINISSPDKPVETGFFDTPGNANGVYVSGYYAFVADWGPGGLRIINISSPASPVETDSYNTSGSAKSVYVSGSYVYVADDPTGISVFRFVSDPILPQVITNSATSVTQTTASSGGNVTSDGGATVTARGVCWSTAQNPTTANSKTANGTGTGSFTSSLTGLTANTTYYVRAYATNSVGTAYGNQISFTTSPTVPVLTTTAASSVTQTTASSGGNITSDGGASVTAKGVCWSTAQNPTTANSKTSDGTGTGFFTSSITGLTANTTYYVRAYATNSAGTAYGNEISFKTSATVPVLTTTAASSVTQTTASSGGNITSDGGASVTAKGVCWSTSSNPTTANSKTSDGTGIGTFTSFITGLTANTTYYVRAYATNSVGTAYGNQISFTTSATVPVLSTTAASSVTQTTASSGGNITSDGGATVTARGVCWSTSSNPTTANSKTADGIGTGSFTSYLTGLTANTTYYVRAYATNSAGTAYGNQISFTTSEEPDTTPPTAPTLSGAYPPVNTWATDNTVGVLWNPGQDTQSGVAGYSCIFDTSASTVPDSTADTAGTQMTSQPLPDGAGHYFHVRTVDNAGNAGPTLHVGPFKIDTAPPAGTLIISNGAATTSSQNVILTLSANDTGSGLSQMKFSNDNANWSSPISYSTSAAWTLTSGDGTKTVYARFSDILGHWTANDIADTILLETIVKPAPPSGLAATPGSRSVTLKWNEVSAETSFHIYRSDAENGFYVRLTEPSHYDPYYFSGKWQQVFTDENRINGIAYWYKITAVSKSGLESDPCAPIMAVPAPLPGGDFRIDLMEKSGTVLVGDTIVFHIVISSEDRFGETVTLNATCPTLDIGVSKVFSQTSVNPTGMSSLTVTVPYNTAEGSHKLKISGYSVSRSHDAEIELNIVKTGIGESRITAVPSKDEVRLGERAEITGQLLPFMAAGTRVSVQIRKPGTAEWTSFPVLLEDSSAYRFSYSPDSTGEYGVKASWSGNAGYFGAESDVSEFTVTRGKAEIFVTTATPAPEPGNTVSIGIELYPQLAGEPLYFEIMKPGLNVPETVNGLSTQAQGKRSFTYTLDANLPGIWKFKAAWAGNAQYTGNISLPLVLYPGIEVGQALVVAGGGMEQNTLWETTEYLANRFYRILQKRRFTHEQIWYITDSSHNYDLNGDGTDDIFVDDHDPSVSDIRNYLESLYRPGQSPLVGANRPLIVYLADHGGVGQFKLNAGEYLKAEDLDAWLDALQTATGCKIVLIAEACSSGTFIDRLVPTGDQQRILISSSNTEVSNYDQKGIQSFSHLFFDQVAQGDSLKTCFYKARKEMGNHHLFQKQVPQIRNELAAADFYIGGTFVVGDILPEIISLTPSQVIDAGNRKLFVEGADAEGLDSAWVSIIPPGFEVPETAGDFQTPVYVFDRADLTDPEKDGIFEGSHDFPYNGDYILTFFVRDTGGNVASQEIRLSVENGADLPVPGNVNGDTGIDLADAILALKIACGAYGGSVNLNADVNNDKRIGLAEAVYVLRKVSGQ